MGVVGFMLTIARARVGRYYKTTIPREVRKLLELRENDEVEWVFENRAVYVRKAQRRVRWLNAPSANLPPVQPFRA